MPTVIEKFVAELGWDVDEKGVKEFQNAIKDVGDKFKTLAKVAAGATAALGVFVGLTNKATAEQTNLARSVGLSAETMESLATVVDGIGFDFEKVVDLVEELNNKMGEFALTGMASVKEGLQLLGLDFKELKRLSPEDQFIKIMDAAKDLGDQQIAQSAVDMIMGGDANKILGHLRNYDGSLKDIVEKHRRLNILTDKGRDGAVRFNRAVGLASLGVKSMGKELSGRLGDALAPWIEKLGDWIANNKELIQQKIGEWVDKLRRALDWIIPRLDDFARWLALIASIVAGAKLIGGLHTFIGLIQKAGWAAFAAWAKALLIPLAIAAAIALVVLAVQDFYTYLKGGKSVFGAWVKDFEAMIGMAVEQWAEWLGMSKEDLDKWIVDTVDAIKKWATGFIDAIIGVWKDAVKFVENVIGGVAGFFENFDPRYGRFAPKPTNNVANKTSVRTNITVNQLPGESSADLVTRVKEVWETDVAQAATANNTGVDY